MSRPDRELELVAGAHRRFLAAIDGLTDGDVRRATALPGWTVGRVLTHVARNAGSHLRRTAAAIAGEMVEQYPGGFEGREAEIQAGATRPAREILADVRDTAAAVDAAWADVPEPAWDNVTRDVGGRERPLSQLPSRRWQELEVHVVDLGVGVTHRDWPDAFVADWLPRLRAYDPGTPAPAGLDEHDELAWRYGRLQRPDLPSPRPWG